MYRDKFNIINIKLKKNYAMIKHTINNLMSKVVSLILLLGLYSCEDFLEIIPKSQVSDAIVWISTDNAQLFLNNIYADIPDYRGEPLDNYSDDGVHAFSEVTSSRNYYNLSVYTPSDAPNHWGSYSSIRKCNLFINNVTSKNLPDSWKTQKLAEARFLRAYYYHLLWTWHGGVPIITEILDESSQGDDIFRARNTSEETFTFITNELASIVNDLPLTAKPAGIATQGAALALKGWCELFEASPLKNPNNDISKWALAAATNKEVMDLGVYNLFPDYNTMLLEENNNNVESIFAKQCLGGTMIRSNIVERLSVAFVGGKARLASRCNPSQELVDAYFMANGLPITDPSSGYDPQNPYLNREQRFYQSIIYDGSEWCGFETVMKQGVGSLNRTDLGDMDVSTNTGYYWRKGLNEKYATFGNTDNSANYVIFRYAEILLSYAEAQNEASGPDASVYEAIRKVRARVELPPLPDGLNQEQMRKAIHRERRVELAVEAKRWYDLLRWRLAEVNLNGNLHAILITFDEENDKWVYESVPAAAGAKKFYPEKNYLLPVPQGAMDRNVKLVQNPGYD